MGANQGTVQRTIQTTPQETVQRTIQTTPQETVQRTIEITPREALRRTSAEPKICSLCFDRYQRRQQAVCTCNHCSLLLCSDCMHNHADELPKNIAQLNRQLHELEQVFQSKQNMIEEEVFQSTFEITQWLKTYQNNLLDAHQAMIAGVEKAKYNAKEYLDKISSELQIIKVDIETLARETIFQPERIEALSNQLNQNQEKLETYEMTKDAELQIVLPKYTIKFQCNPISTTETNESSETESLSVRGNNGRRSSRRHNHHPYKKASASVQKKNTSSRNDETDRN